MPTPIRTPSRFHPRNTIACLLLTLVLPLQAAEPIEADWTVHEMAGSGEVSGDPAAGEVALTGTGTTFLYTPVEGDFQLTVRVLDIESGGHERAAAGLKVVADLDEDSLRSALGVEYRHGKDGGPSRTEPKWLRIQRIDGRVGLYRSWDGRRFKPRIGGSLPGDRVYVGLASSDGRGDAPVTATFDQVRLERPDRDYSVSWFGNSLRGPWPSTVNFNMTGLYTSADGTCYVTSFFEEQGHCIAAFRDGQQVAPDHKTASAGIAVCVAGDFIYTSVDHGFQRIDRATLRGKGHFVPVTGKLKGHEAVRGLAASGTELYVSNAIDQRIEVYDLANLEKIREIPFERPGPLAAVDDGTLWAVSEGWGEDVYAPYTGGTYPRAGRALRIDANDGRVLTTIDDLQVPTGLAVDHERGRLLVAENGPDQQVRVYDVTGRRPRLAGTIGARGGMSAGTHGLVRDDKFCGLSGVGVDAEGRVYVSSNGWPHMYIAPGMMANQVTLRSFPASAVEGSDEQALWELLSLGYIFDGATLDPRDETLAYAGADQEFRMDWSRGDGPLGDYEAYTVNHERFPHEALGRRARCSPWIRYLDDQRFAFLRGHGSLYVYRFDAAEAGRTAIPCAVLSGEEHRKKEPGRWPANQPWEIRTPYVWIDGHGDHPVDGIAQAGEYRIATGFDGHNGMMWDVDEEGGLWHASRRTDTIHHLPFTGVVDGVPTWGSEAEVSKAPAPFNMIQWIRYDSERDRMLLAGRTPKHPGTDDVRNQTTYAAVFPDWSKGNRTPSVEIPLALTPDDYYLDGVQGLAVVDDFLYVTGRPSNVQVYDLRHGNRVIEFWPGPEVHSAGGYFDKDESSVQAFRLSTGEYVALCQENGWCKILVYRWRPDDQPTEAPEVAATLLASAGTGLVDLRWSTPHCGLIEGYHIYRATGSDGPWQRLTDTPHAVSRFADDTVANGQTYRYRITIVNAAGEGPPSSHRTVTPIEATASFLGVDAQTQGDWKGSYGRDGFYIVGDWTSDNNPTVPDYFSINDGSFMRMAGFPPRGEPSERRFLLKAAEGSTARAEFPPGSGYAQKQQRFLLDFADGKTHTLTLYANGHGNGYATEITLRDTTTGEVLDRQRIAARGDDQGRYISWNVTGSLQLDYNWIQGEGFGNYLAGFFLDPVDAELPTENESE